VRDFEPARLDQERVGGEEQQSASRDEL